MAPVKPLPPHIRWELIHNAARNRGLEWGRGADLRYADLRGAYLEGADLYAADLRGADLRGAWLYGADLRGADLYGADLYGANLYGANLGYANLRGAYLRGADLRGANLRGANLRGADLVDAIVTADGKTLDQYMAWLPTLLTAGGRTVTEVAGHWDCHNWSNCPMSAAFGASGLAGVPEEWQEQAAEFILLFDAGALPRPEVKA